jgi:hypothetical protein
MKFIIKETHGRGPSSLHVLGLVGDVLQKAEGVEDEDGVLTELGMSVAARYAKQWIEGVRDLKLEAEFPALAGLFYDIRVDSSLARRHAS